jgi:hypothetical protein
MAIRYIRHPNITLEDDLWCDEQAEIFANMDEKLNETFADDEDLSLEITKRFPYTFTVVKDNDKRIGYTYILPATNDLMNKFSKKELTEGEVVKIINDRIRYNNCDAAYLAGAVFIKQYQNKGHAVRATLDTLIHMDKERGMKIKDLYIWPLTDSMHNIIDKAKRFAEKQGRILHVHNQKE